jgi:hypothetical protein
VFLGEEVKEKGQVSLTDPDSRAMSMGHGSQVGYNVQVAVEAKHSLIIATDVTKRRVTWEHWGRWPYRHRMPWDGNS